MRARALSALVIVPVVVVAFLVGAVGIALLVLVLAVLGAREVETLLRGSGRPVIAGGVVAGAGGLVLLAALGPVLVRPGFDPPAVLADVGSLARDLDGGLAAGLVVVALAMVAFARRDPADGFAAWSSTAFGVVYVSLLGAIVVLTGSSGAEGAAADGWWAERRWVLVLVAIVWGFDTGAYLTGRAIGRHPFFPWISPKKTMEGVAGGLAVAIVTTGIALAVTGADWLPAIVLGPVVGACAQAGDLAESLLKRAAGAKDSGSLIPGHGGILDRVDSFLFAAPVLAAYVALVHP